MLAQLLPPDRNASQNTFPLELSPNRIMVSLPESTLNCARAPCDVVATSRSTVGEAFPIPTFPVFVTTKCVALEDPITKDGPLTLSGFTESKAHGAVVAIPTFPPK